MMIDFNFNTAVLGPESSPSISPVSSPGFSFMSPDITGPTRTTSPDLSPGYAVSNVLQDAWFRAEALFPVATPLNRSASPATPAAPAVGSTPLVPTTDVPPCVLLVEPLSRVLPRRFAGYLTERLLTCFYMMYANCRVFSQFTPGASVLGEVLGHLEVIDTPDNRGHLLKRFKSLFHNHFTHVPVDVVQRHHALFRKASKPVIGLKLDSLGLVYSRPAGL